MCYGVCLCICCNTYATCFNLDGCCVDNNVFNNKTGSENSQEYAHKLFMTL